MANQIFLRWSDTGGGMDSGPAVRAEASNAGSTIGDRWWLRDTADARRKRAVFQAYMGLFSGENAALRSEEDIDKLLSGQFSRLRYLTEPLGYFRVLSTLEWLVAGNCFSSRTKRRMIIAALLHTPLASLTTGAAAPSDQSLQTEIDHEGTLPSLPGFDSKPPYTIPRFYRDPNRTIMYLPIELEYRIVHRFHLRMQKSAFYFCKNWAPERLQARNLTHYLRSELNNFREILNGCYFPKEALNRDQSMPHLMHRAGHVRNTHAHPAAASVGTLVLMNVDGVSLGGSFRDDKATALFLTWLEALRHCVDIIELRVARQIENTRKAISDTRAKAVVDRGMEQMLVELLARQIVMPTIVDADISGALWELFNIEEDEDDFVPKVATPSGIMTCWDDNVGGINCLMRRPERDALGESSERWDSWQEERRRLELADDRAAGLEIISGVEEEEDEYEPPPAACTIDNIAVAVGDSGSMSNNSMQKEDGEQEHDPTAAAVEIHDISVVDHGLVSGENKDKEDEEDEYEPPPAADDIPTVAAGNLSSKSSNNIEKTQALDPEASCQMTPEIPSFSNQSVAESKNHRPPAGHEFEEVLREGNDESHLTDVPLKDKQEWQITLGDDKSRANIPPAGETQIDDLAKNEHQELLIETPMLEPRQNPTSEDYRPLDSETSSMEIANSEGNETHRTSSDLENQHIKPEIFFEVKGDSGAVSISNSAAEQEGTDSRPRVHESTVDNLKQHALEIETITQFTEENKKNSTHDSSAENFSETEGAKNAKIQKLVEGTETKSTFQEPNSLKRKRILSPESSSKRQKLGHDESPRTSENVFSPIGMSSESSSLKRKREPSAESSSKRQKLIHDGTAFTGVENIQSHLDMTSESRSLKRKREVYPEISAKRHKPNNIESEIRQGAYLHPRPGTGSLKRKRGSPPQSSSKWQKVA